MEDYKRGSHTVWDCKYHLVWTTKYRYEVLGRDVGQRCREFLREIGRSLEMMLYIGSINRDHAHMLIGIPPYILVSSAVPEGEEFAQTAKRVCGIAQAVLGAAPVGARVLVGHQRQRNG